MVDSSDASLLVEDKERLGDTLDQVDDITLRLFESASFILERLFAPLDGLSHPLHGAHRGANLVIPRLELRNRLSGFNASDR